MAHLTWQANEVVSAVRAHSLHEQSWAAHGISFDSRVTQPGDLFIALKGAADDGHDYVASAIENGAVAAIVSRQPPQTGTDAPLLLVENTFQALEDLGRAGRQRTAGKIIAVTGSVGKTSSKEMLRVALSATGGTYANEGNLNSRRGVPLSLARLPADADYGVFELGMNHAGELGPLSQQVSPHVALITNVETVHLEFFASTEAIADAKAEIFIGTQKTGSVVLNRDNRHFAHLAAAAKNAGIKNILSFGRDGKADARLIDYAPEQNAGIITAEIQGHSLRFKLGVPGDALALNAVGALLAVSAAGSDVEACAEALAGYRQIKGRGVIQTLPLAEGELTIIDESYNASHASVGLATRILGQMRPEPGGRRLLILGDMRELGETSPALHAALAKEIIAAKIDLVFCCGDMMAYLYDALPDDMRGGWAADSASLTPHLVTAVRADDIVTVKGSNSMGMTKIVSALIALSKNQTTHQLAG